MLGNLDLWGTRLILLKGWRQMTIPGLVAHPVDRRKQMSFCSIVAFILFLNYVVDVLGV